MMPVQATPVFAGITETGLGEMVLPTAEEVQVWLVPVKPVDFARLTDAEAARAGRFRASADADRFGTARIALRRLAGHYLHLPPEAVEIAGGANQKPFLAGKMSRPLHFNLSHSGSLVLIAFGGSPLGIDAEAIDPRFDPENIIPEHFSVPERTAIAAASDPLTAFYQLWTRKEALVKARGSGLGDALNQLSVLPALVAGETPEDQWQLHSFISAPGYANALACRVSVARIGFYQMI